MIVTHRTELKATRRSLYTPALPGAVLARLSAFKGVSVADGQAAFDRSLHTEETAHLAVLFASREPVRLDRAGVVRRSLAATEDDLKVINERHSQDTLSAEDLVIFEDYAISDGPMRRPLRMTKRALEKLALDFVEGRTTLLHHREDYPVGFTFAAEVRSETVAGQKANWLVVRHAGVFKDASAERLQHLSDMRRGTLRYTSITFGGGGWEYEELPDSDEWFFRVDDNPEATSRDRLEAVELSRVYLGAVVGAGAAMSATETETSEEGGEGPAPLAPDTGAESARHIILI